MELQLYYKHANHHLASVKEGQTTESYESSLNNTRKLTVIVHPGRKINKNHVLRVMIGSRTRSYTCSMEQLWHPPQNRIVLSHRSLFANSCSTIHSS